MILDVENDEEKMEDIENEFIAQNVETQKDVEEMNKFVEEEYDRLTKGIGFLRLKKVWKDIRNKKLNETKEKHLIRYKYILDKLTEE